ncbi:ribosomal protein S5 domain 2-type protein [Irpex rosettiformis]|uniref:Ribosomal protein S5 domain 2-type protein n=1 Tax=Irpex rosettiformis TaxID=378272 RepID=A0ACB8TXJ1_9APHY|nr:ribosomal protein S5 domain 2-type protein [Irpex rosettiformis]
MISISKSEKSYIQESLRSTLAFREDGRGLSDFRSVFLETGIAPLANGSARVNLGKAGQEGGGGTEAIAAVKLEVEDVQSGDGVDGGRVACNVSCSPAAYSHISSNALDNLQHDYTTLLHQVLSHPTLHPKNLGILPHKKAWLLSLDVTILSDAGNAFDVIFMAARAALWDTKVPRTRSIQYAGRKSVQTPEEAMDVDGNSAGPSNFNTRDLPTATDFELADTWDEGEPLEGRERWPVCITLNIDSPVHYLDATLLEEAATPLRLLLLFSFPSSSSSILQSMKLLGPGELKLSEVTGHITDGEKYARTLFNALESKLRDEDLRRNQKARTKFAGR